MGEKISVIIPIYNAEEYLKECLDSVVNQAYVDYEVILVNDGSTDQSEKICLDYVRKYEFIKYHYRDNAGVSASRNFGMEQATGTWLCFVDADDIMSEFALERLMYFAKEDFDWVIANYSYTSTELRKGNKCCPYNSLQIQKLILNSPNYPKLYNSFPFRFDDIILMTVWGKLYRKSIIDEFRVEFCTDLRVCEDVVFNYEYVRRCEHSLAVSDDILYFYRKSKNTASMQINAGRINNLENLVMRMQQLKNTAINDIKHDIDVYCCKMIVLWACKIQKYGDDDLIRIFLETLRTSLYPLVKEIRFTDWLSRGRKQKIEYAITLQLMKRFWT